MKAKNFKKLPAVKPFTVEVFCNCGNGKKGDITRILVARRHIDSVRFLLRELYSIPFDPSTIKE